MSGLRDAVTLLTRVPLRTSNRESRLSGAVPWFPVVGAFIGFTIAGVYAGMILFAQPLVASGVAIAFGVLLTGAFHEDGLADVADAFGGGVHREDRLRILKDPRLGTFGVVAITLSLLLRVGAVAGLDRTAALLALPAAHALSRAAAVGAMIVFRPIDEGLGASYAYNMKRGTALIGVLVGVVIAALLIGLWAAVGVVVAVAAMAAIGRLALKKIGGVNGDVLGAIQQVSEIALLVMCTAIVRKGGQLGW